jgi:hypothetical protein
MKKTVMLLLVMVLLVTPAFAQQTKRNPRASQVNPNVAKMLNAYNRMNRANKQSAAAALSGQAKSPFVSVTPPDTSPSAVPAALPPTDRPFDANGSAVNPFGPTAFPPGSLSNLPPAFGPGIDPFGPGQLTVDPFTPGNPSPATLFSANPLEASPTQGISPGSSMTATPNALIIRKTPQLKLQPLDGILQQAGPLSSNPYSLLSGSDPLSAYRSPYTTDSMIPGSRFQPLAFP